MESSVNVPTVVIANTIGIVLLMSVVFGNLYLIRETVRRNKNILYLIIITISTCFIDIFAFLSDGVNTVAVIFLNTLLYISGPILATIWIFLIAKYINVTLSKTHKIIIFAFDIAAILLITVNLFTPILFTVNSYGRYERISGVYLVYATCYFGLLADAIGMYLIKKYQSGGIKFFPIWAFVIPVGMGMLIQILFYGVSTIGPFMTISITAMTISFQNNLLFKDQLTDLYNRYYLSILDRRLLSNSKKVYSIIMLDLNDFKSINDIYGHDTGDKALSEIASLLVSSVDNKGEVIRYAGDEFIILQNSKTDKDTVDLIKHINDCVQDFNSKETRPYKFSLAIGWSKGVIGEVSINELITSADKAMYENKNEYYGLGHR